MIYTSDNEVYEDATSHALDVKKDLSQQGFSAQGKKKDPIGDLITTGEPNKDKLDWSQFEQSDVDYLERLSKIPFELPTSLPLSKNIETTSTGEPNPQIEKDWAEVWENPPKLSRDLGFQDIEKRMDEGVKRGEERARAKAEWDSRTRINIDAQPAMARKDPFGGKPDAGGAASPIPEFKNQVLTTAATMQAEPTPKKTGPPTTTNRGKIPRHKVEE